MRLLLDVGNTLLKWRLLGESEVHGGVIPQGEWREALAGVTADTQADAVWVSSVAGAAMETELTDYLADAFKVQPWFARTEASAMGLQNSYREPERMGVDRWLAMLAAWQPRHSAVCIVDAGSALTIDFVSATGEHLGGYILPGMDSMERALLTDTDRVRFGSAARDQLEPGRSTEEAVYNGLLLSQAGAVSMALHRVRGDFGLLFTGGNGETLHQCLRLGGDYVPNLVLDGLKILGEEKVGSWSEL